MIAVSSKIVPIELDRPAVENDSELKSNRPYDHQNECHPQRYGCETVSSSPWEESIFIRQMQSIDLCF